MRMQNLNWPVLFLIAGMASCGGPSGQSASEAPSDRQTEIRLRQYIVQGKSLYTTHCANCHQADGSGLARLYPPLAGADYLMADLPRAACMIREGKIGEITVNGITYNQMMPGNPGLAPIEVAEILTYITNSWGNEAGISTTRDVSQWLENCEK